MILPLHLFRFSVTPIILGLVKVILSNAFGSQSEIDPASQNQTSKILFDKILLMPQFLALPMIILTLLFDLCGILSAGKRFCNQSTNKRNKQYHQWRNSKLTICRDFIVFFDRLSLFIYFSNTIKTTEKPISQPEPLS